MGGEGAVEGVRGGEGAGAGFEGAEGVEKAGAEAGEEEEGEDEGEDDDGGGYGAGDRGDALFRPRNRVRRMGEATGNGTYIAEALLAALVPSVVGPAAAADEVDDAGVTLALASTGESEDVALEVAATSVDLRKGEICQLLGTANKSVRGVTHDEDEVEVEVAWFNPTTEEATLRDSDEDVATDTGVEVVKSTLSVMLVRVAIASALEKETESEEENDVENEDEVEVEVEVEEIELVVVDGFAPFRPAGSENTGSPDEELVDETVAVELTVSDAEVVVVPVVKSVESVEVGELVIVAEIAIDDGKIDDGKLDSVIGIIVVVDDDADADADTLLSVAVLMVRVVVCGFPWCEKVDVIVET